MILLKSKLSGFYFKEFGVWVRDPAQAHPFADEWSARAFARSEHLEDVTPAEAAAEEGTLLAA